MKEEERRRGREKGQSSDLALNGCRRLLAAGRRRGTWASQGGTRDGGEEGAFRLVRGHCGWAGRGRTEVTIKHPKTSPSDEWHLISNKTRRISPS